MPRRRIPGRSNATRLMPSALTTARRSCRPGRGDRAARSPRHAAGAPVADGGRVGRHASPDAQTGLDRVPLPARDLVVQHRDGYHCLLFKPIWLVETARGCPYPVPLLLGLATVRSRLPRAVRGRGGGGLRLRRDAIFVADDLFWHHPARSRELAEALRRRGVSKRWILVQTRTDIICRHDGAARGVAAPGEGLRHLLRVRGGQRRRARAGGQGRGGRGKPRGGAHRAVLGYGVNGNFLIDPTGRRRTSRSCGISWRATIYGEPGSPS